MENSRRLYLMISCTNTRMGNLIRFFTRYKYNHVSLSIDKNLRNFVSFARFVQDAPLYGGLVNEPLERFLHGGKDSNVKIFEVDISAEKYEKLQKLFAMADNPECGLLYNYFDALATTVGVPIRIPGAYTCLGLARAVLGKNYKNIKALANDLSDKLIYEGPISRLGADSGDRSALYFKKIGVTKGTYKSVKGFLIVCRRVINKNIPDEVYEIQN